MTSDLNAMTAGELRRQIEALRVAIGFQDTTNPEQVVVARALQVQVDEMTQVHEQKIAAIKLRGRGAVVVHSGLHG